VLGAIDERTEGDAMNDPPKVSVGLPVFNGERFVAEAMDSILAQTFEDFELIISDNASTDRTEEICRAYADKDERVRYVRNRANLGAAYNFNQTFRLSSGQYFKWAAHDDALRPQFLQRCIEILDRDSSVVIAYPRWKAIDEASRPQDYEYAPWDVTSPVPHRRFRNAMRMAGLGSVPIFGLIRSEVLDRTELHRAYAHGDHVLLSELSLYGTFHEIPEELQLHRWHAGRYSLISSTSGRVGWWTPASTRKFPLLIDTLRLAVLPVVLRGMGHLGAVARAPIGWRGKVRCDAEFVRWGCWKVWQRLQRRFGG
jgi:glycosyltransferase involved in cell wall biosynthesis